MQRGLERVLGVRDQRKANLDQGGSSEALLERENQVRGVVLRVFMFNYIILK